MPPFRHENTEDVSSAFGAPRMTTTIFALYIHARIIIIACSGADTPYPTNTFLFGYMPCARIVMRRKIIFDGNFYR